MAATRETRVTASSRAARVVKREDGTSVVEGYAAVFYRQDQPGTEYRLWDDLVERVAPGAFDRALRERQDVRALFNHDPNQLLGRTAAETLRLSVDAIGLRYEITLPDTQLGRELPVLMERGDVSGSSFSFVARKVSYQRGEAGKPDVRTLEDVDLWDVGPVVFPAYEGTTAAARAVGDVDEILAERQHFREMLASDAEAVRVRCRLLELDACEGSC
ncbi:MAG: HK97 family phage prohead protease [Planctomycetota bacterium]